MSETEDAKTRQLLDSHPNAPRQGPVWLACGLVAFSGLLGGLIGYSLIGASCTETAPLLQRILNGAEPGVTAVTRSCATQQLLGALVGSLVSSIGVAIVAVLTLRAMNEWRKSPPPQRTS